jgi:ribosomal protein L16 Arg81 hydroxylase
MKSTDFHSLLNPDSAEGVRAPGVVTGRELQELISPISCKDFVNSYFSRASLRVQGNRHKFDHLFSWEKLNQALATGQNISDRRYNITASFTSGEESGSSRRMIEAYHNQIGELLQAGATICITNIHMADPLLAQWARSIRSQMNFTGTVGVNCYISPDGSGLPTHYDKRVATTLQIAGKKRWRFSTEPAKAWPTHNAVYQEGQVEPQGVDPGRLPPDMEFREEELSPGDLLCLPAGAWHSACAVGDSLALNLYFAPRNFLEHLIPLFHDFAVSNEDWRAGPPATIEKAQGDMPKTVSAYMRERLDEFHRMVLEVLDGPDALTESWLNSLTYNPHTGWRPTPKSSPRPVTPEQPLRVATPSLRFIQLQDNVMLPCDNGILKFPTTAAPILRRLSSQVAGFTLHDVLAWREDSDEPTPNEIMALLQTLMENGIIEIAG